MAAQGYDKINAVLKMLHHYKYSTLFHTFIDEFMGILKSGKLELSGQPIEFNSSFVEYFIMGGVDRPFEDFLAEPSEIVRIKKTINVIHSIEQLLKELEQFPCISFKLASYLNDLRRQARAISVEVLQLNVEYVNLFSANSNTCSMFMIESLKILDVINGGFSGEENQWPVLKNGLKTFTNRMDKLKASFSGADLATLLGSGLGFGVQLCAPDSEDSQSIGYILSMFPNLLKEMSLQVQKVTQFFASTHGNLDPLQVQNLQRQTDLFLNRLNQFAYQSEGFSLNIVSLIYNCRKIYNITLDIIQNLGQLKQSSQLLIKKNLHELKFTFILGVITSLDAIEIDMFLKCGSLTDQLLPYLENCYWSFSNFCRPYIDFNAEEQHLLHLLEPSWQQARINAVSVRQSEAFIRKNELLQQDNFYQNIKEDPSDENTQMYFTALADDIKRVDDSWFNRILNQLNDDDTTTALEESDNLEQLGMLIKQKISSQDYFMQNLSILRERLSSQEQQHVSYFLETSELNYSHIASRLYAESALVRFRQQFYWFNRQNLSLIPVALNLSLQELTKKEVAPNFLCCIDQQIACYFSNDTNKVMLNSVVPIRKKIEQSAVELELENLDLSQLKAWIKTSYIILNDLKDYQKAFTSFYSQLQIYRTYGQGSEPIRPEWFAELVRNFKLFAQEIPSLVVDWSSVGACCDSVSIHAAKLTADFSQQIQQQELRLEEYTRQYLIKKSEQDLSAYQRLLPLSRVGYFLRSTCASEFFNSLEQKLEGLLKFYSPVTLPFFQKEESVCYDLLPKKELALYPYWLGVEDFPGEAKQLVEPKILLNIVILLKMLFSDLEQQKVSDIEQSRWNGVTAGGVDLITNKKELLVFYLDCQSYLFAALGPKYHLTMLNQHIQKFFSFNQHLKNELKQHDLQPTDDSTTIDQFIHWFFSAPQLIHHYADGQQFLVDERMNLQLSERLKGIISNSDSWLLLIKIPHIYQVFTAFKQKWQQLTSSIYNVSYDHLAEMKFELAKQFILCVDEFEADLGLNPSYCSNPVMQFIDVLFDHFFMSLKLDLSTYSKLMLDKRLQQYRLTIFEEKIRLSHQQEMGHRSNLADLEHFNRMFHSIPQSSPEETIKSILFSSFKVILPLLVQHESERGEVEDDELRTSLESKWDERFHSWIVEIQGDEKFKPSYVEKLCDFIQKNYKGLCKTESLKIALYQHKKQCVQAVIDVDIQQSLQQYTQLYYERACQQIIDSRQLMFGNVNHFYINTLQEFFKENQQQIADRVSCLMHSQLTNINGNASVQVFFLNELYSLLRNFDVAYHHQFVQLESIYFAIHRFEEYQSTVVNQLSNKQIDTFESMTTLTEKKHLFDTIQKLASSELPITQRLNTIKEFVEQESFQHKMLNYCAHLSMFNFRKSDWGTIFSHIFMYFKQRILLALAKIGLYQPTSLSCLQMLRDAVKSSPSASPDINQYSLFQGLKKPVLNVISYEVAPVH